MSDSSEGPAEIRCHVFTNLGAAFFLKQFPGFEPMLEGVRFSFGLGVPADADVLILFARASYSIPTWLPRERTLFIAAEPDVIHPYSSRFLDQFGIVISATDKPLATEQWRTSPCWPWFAGVDYSRAADGFPKESLKGVDWFSALEMPEKQDLISVVTSNKAFTHYQRKRIAFIEELARLIPDRLVIYGHGQRSIDDKKDALLPYRYHLAIENCDGPDLWTEKLADPFLCGAFPFYAGCTNVESYFPAGSFEYIDLEDVEAAARHMVSLIENESWRKAADAMAEARRLVLTQHNVARLLVRLTRAAMAKEVAEAPRRQRLIRSERSLWPEEGSRGSIGEWALRSAALALHPGAELRAAALQGAVERRRMRRRAAKRARQEAANGKERG